MKLLKSSLTRKIFYILNDVLGPGAELVLIDPNYIQCLKQTLFYKKMTQRKFP